MSAEPPKTHAEPRWRRALIRLRVVDPRMRLSANGARFIADHEGTYLKRYNDPVGHCTVGIGHLLHYGPCDGRKGEFDLPSKEAAWQLLIDDVERSYAPAVRRLITYPLNQNQFDALVSFTYNNGVGSLEESTLRRVINAGELHRVPQELARWVNAGKPPRPLPGLVRRRREEAELFMRPASGQPTEPEKPADPWPDLFVPLVVAS